MAPTVALVAVATPGLYADLAHEMFESAAEFFRPTHKNKIVFECLEAFPGWPDATMLRHHVVLKHLPRTDYVFVIDADMRFEAKVGPEILGGESSLTATLHPGYVGRLPQELPFEDRAESACYVNPELRSRYFCGGFVGGERLAYQWLAMAIKTRIDSDVAEDRVPVWHDESALNAVLTLYEFDDVVLSPSYCYPSEDGWYKTFWPETYKRRIVAVDKTPEQRALTGR